MRTKTEMTAILNSRSKRDKTQHTPGPWKLSEDSTGLYDLVSDFDNTWIATIHGGYDEETNRDEKDARLIAAAPDLLGAARAGLECVEWQIAYLNERGEYVPKFLIDTEEQLRTAIAKAEGKNNG